MTGDIIDQDICGTGVNIVAARSIPRNEKAGGILNESSNEFFGIDRTA
jgi:hypothetical protein